MPPRPITFENVGIAVFDLEATIAFFTDLGLTVVGRDTSVEWTDTAAGLDGNHANIYEGRLASPSAPRRRKIVRVDVRGELARGIEDGQ